MNILSISKEKRKAVVELNSDELVLLCNTLYKVITDKENDGNKDEEPTKHEYQIYIDLMIARDLTRYGHIDEFCSECIAKCREKIRELNLK